MKSYEEINQKIKEGRAVVVTAEEIIPMVKEEGVKKVAQKVDVVTTGTFGPMCSSGVFLNFGHSEPPIKMSKVWLNNVPAYTGIAAVDAYLGATELSERNNNRNLYGGAHVIEDLLNGKKVKLKAFGSGTDCYPCKEVEGYLGLEDVNEAIMFNPRNAYQNYAAATNTTDKTIFTYLGALLPKMGNINYSTSGQLSPLLNDPDLRTVGIGTRIFLGGTVGYVAWNGTQHNTSRPKENGVPILPGATLSLIGDLKNMSSDYIKAGIFEKYGVSMFVGIGIPIPILDEDMLEKVAVSDEKIYTHIFDYGVGSGSRPIIAKVNYKQLKSGFVEINGKNIRTAPLSSLKKARKIADILKDWIKNGQFTLQQPVELLPTNVSVKAMNLKEEGSND